MSYFKKVIVFTLAFCSIVYELILAQGLAAFLENTVLRYSVTIGLYMFAMGMGSMFISEKSLKDPVLSLLKTEIGLAFLGATSIIFLHIVDAVWPSRLFFLLCAHFLMIAIGYLTGFEIPLLLAWKENGIQSSEFRVVGVNYFGAFCGTLAFAFLFYRFLGLLPSALIVGSLNALVGVLLFLRKEDVRPEVMRQFRLMGTIQSVLFLCILVAIFKAEALNIFFMNLYLK